MGFCKRYAGKKREDIEKCINEGVYQVDRLKEEGFITSILYDDEVHAVLWIIGLISCICLRYTHKGVKTKKNEKHKMFCRLSLG